MSKTLENDYDSKQLEVYDTSQDNYSVISSSLSSLITDLQLHSLSFNNHTDLCNCMCINKHFHSSITQAQKLWRDLLYNSLWKNKTYIPKRYINWINSDTKEHKSPEKDINITQQCNTLKAYHDSFLDQKRTVITIDELCNIVWYFRFKQSAGTDWIENDPFWQSDSSDSADENKTDDKYYISTKFNPAKCIKIQFKRDGTSIRHGKFKNFRNTNMNFTWRFTGSHCKEMEYGNAIQVNNFPSYYISRHPYNWGWIMQSCWVIYSSFPLPPPGSKEDKIINNDLTSIQYSEMMSFNIFGSATRISSKSHNIYESNNPFSDSNYIQNIDINNNYSQINEMKNVNDENDENDRLLNVLSMLGNLQ
eukprot:499719_1